MSGRKMPRPVDLGRQFTTTMAQAMGQLNAWQKTPANPNGLRVVMGFFLPSWQRGLVWTVGQKIAFIESAWRGINLGTYTYNQTGDIGSPFDDLLIDGQQRMNAIECYLRDEFPVLGWRWSEVTEADRRRWGMSIVFGSFVTNSEDETYLRSYYDLMNFGGTPHQQHERAALSTDTGDE